MVMRKYSKFPQFNICHTNMSVFICHWSHTISLIQGFVWTHMEWSEVSHPLIHVFEIILCKQCRQMTEFKLINKQGAWRPNKLHCIIKLTKLSTYYISNGYTKRPSVECYHMASIYHNTKMSPVFMNIYRIAEKIWAPWHMNPVEIFCKIDEKVTFELILALCRVKRARKYGPQGLYFTHTCKYPWYAVKNVSWSHSKNFWRKLPKISKNPNFN